MSTHHRRRAVAYRDVVTSHGRHPQLVAGSAAEASLARWLVRLEDAGEVTAIVAGALRRARVTRDDRSLSMLGERLLVDREGAQVPMRTPSRRRTLEPERGHFHHRGVPVHNLITRGPRERCTPSAAGSSVDPVDASAAVAGDRTI